MIYNNLDKITNSTLDNETLRQLRQFCKAFSNDYTSLTSWIRQSSFPVLENNIAIMTREIVNVDLKEMARERGKREENSLQNCTTCPTCPNVPLSHITKNKCNKKDNILIYNNLDKNTISCWDNGTMGQVGQFCKVFLTAIHSPISWMWQTSIPCPRKSCSYTTTW